MKQENLEDGDRILYTQSFLNVLFDDPLWDIGEDLEKGTIEKILKQWVKPIIKKGSYKDNPYFALIYIKSALYGLPARLEKGNLYVSGLFSIIRAIQTIIMHKLPGYDLDIEMFSGLLTRHTVHKFYHIGPEGKKVLEKVDNQSRSDDPYKETFEKSVAILFESLRVSYMETTNKKNREFSSSLSEMFKKLENSKGDAFNKIFKKVVGMAGHLLQSKVKEGKDRDILRFSRDGIKKAEAMFPHNPEIVKGIEQIRIERRGFIDLPTILNAVVNVMYHKEDLFLVFDPYDLTMGIYDRKNIEICKNSVSITLNLTEIMQGALSNKSIKKLFEKKEELFKLKKKSKQEAIKKMFDDAYDMIKRYESAKVQIVTRNGVAVYMDFLLRDQNLDKFEEIKNYKRGEEGVTRSTAIEEHGTQKTAIVSKGKVKYKK